MPTRVKICGITTWDDARLSVGLGASALGFNFYPSSPRAISPADAWKIIRRLPPFVEAVGVFVNWPPLVVDALAKSLRLSTVQLHGGESPAEVAEVARAARRYGRIILAGGLTPENIAEAIRVAEPYAVDIASGVEARPGRKDPARLRALFAAVETARG